MKNIPVIMHSLSQWSSKYRFLNNINIECVAQHITMPRIPNQIIYWGVAFQAHATWNTPVWKLTSMTIEVKNAQSNIIYIYIWKKWVNKILPQFSHSKLFFQHCPRVKTAHKYIITCFNKQPLWRKPFLHSRYTYPYPYIFSDYVWDAGEVVARSTFVPYAIKLLINILA